MKNTHAGRLGKTRLCLCVCVSVCVCEGKSRVCEIGEKIVCVVCLCSLVCVFFFLALIPPVRQRFNKQHTRIKGTSLYTHTRAVSSYCSVHTLCTRS